MNLRFYFDGKFRAATYEEYDTGDRIIYSIQIEDEELRALFAELLRLEYHYGMQELKFKWTIQNNPLMTRHRLQNAVTIAISALPGFKK